MCALPGSLDNTGFAWEYLRTAPGFPDNRLHYAAHGRFWSSHLWRAAAGAEGMGLTPNLLDLSIY